MSASELKLGRVRLAEIPGGDRTNAVGQVASGVDPQGLDVVLLRLGNLAVALEPPGALELGRALIEEAELTARNRAQARHRA
jgi:hypothetical protein